MARDLYAIIAELETLAKSRDPEGAHARADALLLEAIDLLSDHENFWAVADLKQAFLRVPRWYA